MITFGNGQRAIKRFTTSSFLALDIRRLQRDGVLQPGSLSTSSWSRNGAEAASLELRSEPDRVWLSYRLRCDEHSWHPVIYPVTVEWTPCQYGGSRPWFRCPAHGCGRRVAILYAGRIFACRHCYRLAYPSQREAPHARALRRTRAIRAKLGGAPNLLRPFPARPKGMHWRTYRRLQKKSHQAEKRSWPPWLLKVLFAEAQRLRTAKLRIKRSGGMPLHAQSAAADCATRCGRC